MLAHSEITSLLRAFCGAGAICKLAVALRNFARLLLGSGLGQEFTNWARAISKVRSATCKLYSYTNCAHHPVYLVHRMNCDNRLNAKMCENHLITCVVCNAGRELLWVPVCRKCWLMHSGREGWPRASTILEHCSQSMLHIHVYSRPSILGVWMVCCSVNTPLLHLTLTVCASLQGYRTIFWGAQSQATLLR